MSGNLRPEAVLARRCDCEQSGRWTGVEEQSVGADRGAEQSVSISAVNTRVFIAIGDSITLESTNKIDLIMLTKAEEHDASGELTQCCQLEQPALVPPSSAPTTTCDNSVCHH